MIIGKEIIHYKEIDSTNDEARRLIVKGKGEGAVVVADSQGEGRGKPGSDWFSPPGSVYLSAIVKPFQNPAELSSITLLGARAAQNTIRELVGIDAPVKPPNDVLIGKKKVCGILVERVVSGHVIIGIGLNINNVIGSFPEDLRDKATSLLIESGKRQDVSEAARILIAELDKEYLAYLAEI
jgi:BirA family biotin operon repressor/biotin-[acetyl-CoA-carboxylase] ligase